MKVDRLLEDPGYQLNLLLWMTREQEPAKPRIRPLFRELHFEIIYVEQPITLPVEVATSIANKKLDVSVEPEPELLLRRDQDRKALLLEAKKTSFSAASSNSRQARGYLVAVGENGFREVFGTNLTWLLCYVLPHKAQADMANCLNELHGDLDKQSLKPGPWSVNGFSYRDGNILFTRDDHFGNHTGMLDEEVIIMSGIEDDTDPAPLFLVYTDEDYPDEGQRNLFRAAFLNQAYAVLLCELNGPGDKFDKTADQLLTRVTNDIWQYMGKARQKAMRRLITERLFRRVAEYWRERKPGLVDVSSGRLGITFTTLEDRKTFLDWLEDYKKVLVSTEPLTGEPLDDMPLFKQAGLE